jgi:hypothetical protein
MRAALCAAVLMLGCTKAGDEQPHKNPEPPALPSDATTKRPAAARAHQPDHSFAGIKGWRILPWGIRLSEAQKQLDAAGVKYEVDKGHSTYYPRRFPKPGAKRKPTPLRHHFVHELRLADRVTFLRFDNFRFTQARIRSLIIGDRRRAWRKLEALTAPYGAPHRTQHLAGGPTARIWENSTTRLTAYVWVDRSRPGLITHRVIQRWEPVKPPRRSQP